MFRRIAALTLALMLCGCALASGRYVVRAGDVAALTDADGRVLLAGDDIASIFEVRPNALYAAGMPGDFALYGPDGEPLGDARFSMIDDMGGALIFCRDGLYGAMDASGRVILEAAWTQLTAAGDGRYLATLASPLDEQPDEIFLVSGDGIIEGTGVYTDVGLRPVSEGRMPYRGPEGRYGCLDAGGRAAIPEIWAWMGDFVNGAAIASDGSLYGLIDADGGTVVEPRYTWLQRCGERLIGLCEDGRAEALSPDGAALWSVRTSGQIEPVGEGLLVREADGCMLYDARGEAIYTGPADALVFPGLDGQFIVSDGPWGEACQWLLGPDGAAASGRYQRILPLCAARYAFQTFGDGFEDVRCGLLAADGSERLPAAFTDILPAGADRLILVSGDSVAFADPDGNIIADAL